MVDTRRLEALVDRALSVARFPDGPLVLALSGGADSATLGFLLTRAGRAFRALHVHHGLAHSDRLELAATRIAQRLDSPLQVLRVDLAGGASVEGRARDARYEALHSALGVGEVLLTGHTLDDQAETVVLNLLRGAGTAGLAGIPEGTDDVARPILPVTRSETRELAALARLPYLDDPANLDLAHRRNVVRLEVLPMLASRFNPRLAESLARTASHLTADESLLGGLAARVPVLSRDGAVAVAVGALVGLPRPVADRVLRRCLSAVRPPHPGTSAELEEVRAVLLGQRPRVVLEGQIEARREGPLLTLSSPTEGKAEAMPPVPLEPGVHVVAGVRLEVERVEGPCRVAPIGVWSAVFPSDVELAASGDAHGVTVTADGEPAWVPGEKRLPVAWYRAGSHGYLSVVAMEDSRWT